jgi:hypothetical protein
VALPGPGRIGRIGAAARACAGPGDKRPVRSAHAAGRPDGACRAAVARPCSVQDNMAPIVMCCQMVMRSSDLGCRSRSRSISLNTAAE